MNLKLKKLAIDLYTINAIKFGNFTLKTGLCSPVYFDLRVIISHPHVMTTLSELIADKVLQLNEIPKHICGVPYTALPLATLIACKLNKGMVMRRKETKNYGTKKTIEGVYSKDDTVVIIEDVITSGSSIIETANDLVAAGLKVNYAIVVLDREQGACKNLRNQNIEPITLLTLSNLLEILFMENLIEKTIMESVTLWINDNSTEKESTTKFQISLEKRIKLSENLMVKNVLTAIEKKKSLLVVAADVKTSAELLEIAQKVGRYVVILKTHVDVIQDFNKDVAVKLREIADNEGFLILEDRKFCDIGNTVALQFEQVADWADLVTIHSLAGPGVIKGIREVCGKFSNAKGCFMVAELSCNGALTNTDYAEATLNMAKENRDIVVGLVCQSKALLINEPAFLQLTPGVSLKDSGDNLGQQYVTPDQAIGAKGADLIVVGRGIISSDDVAAAAEKYQKASWTAFTSIFTK